ncbi:uncharacterized protein LOC122638790 [Telopea speciosissima]|uniref:uncharacterized protein LOC122638790 n=1 Tax=Telopea speciosissima TaxID=54955 RepID=UPI001CC46DC8|nr:uncharacterized protein LOC122638790 [Telopea speciosissima]
MKSLIKSFEEITFEYLPRVNNRFTDGLATLASMVECSPDAQILPFLADRRCKTTYKESLNALTTNERTWFTPIIDFIRDRNYPLNSTMGEQKRLRKSGTQFMLQGDLLYKRSYDGIQLLCVDEEQAQVIMEEIHQGICGPHMNAKILAKKILGMGYYWITMEADCASFAIHVRYSPISPKFLQRNSIH